MSTFKSFKQMPSVLPAPRLFAAELYFSDSFSIFTLKVIDSPEEWLRKKKRRKTWSCVAELVAPFTHVQWEETGDGGRGGVNVLNHRTLVYVISTTLCHYPTLTQWWHHDLGKQSRLPCVAPCGDIVIRLHDSPTCSRAKYVLTSYVQMMKQDFFNTSHCRERRNHETL